MKDGKRRSYKGQRPIKEKAMTAEEMWKQSGLKGEYEAWSFGGAPDKLAALVLNGVKTATCSAFDLYAAKGEKLPEIGDKSIILDSEGNAICIIATTKVYIVPFGEVTADHAFKEGEGDRSLEYWRKVHVDFFKNELVPVGREFDEDLRLVCEEFEVIYK